MFGLLVHEICQGAFVMKVAIGFMSVWKSRSLKFTERFDRDHFRFHAKYRDEWIGL